MSGYFAWMHRDMYRRVSVLENIVSRFDDEIAQMQADIATIATELDSVHAQIAAGDNAAADKLQPLADRLRGVAASVPTPPIA